MRDLPASRFLNRHTPPNIVTLVCVAGLPALSMNVFLPSLPAMTEYFNTEYAIMQLSVPLYFAMNALLQLFVGPISDRFGRRPVILWSFVVFLLATLGCIYATTIEVFLLFRLLQAIIVAGMVLSRAVVRDIVSTDRAASMIAYVTMGMAIVPMAGPAIGGVLEEAYGWKSPFYLLIVAGAAIMVLVWFDLGETARTKTSSFRQQFSEYPELFKSRRFWGYGFAAALSSGAFFAYVGGAPFVATSVFGLSPTATGLYMGMPALGYIFGNLISGLYSQRFGINRMMLGGTFVTSIGLLISWALLTAGASHPLAFFGLVVSVGVGNGMLLPNATSGLLAVRPHLAGSASGIGGAIMIGGGAILSALAGAVLAPETGVWPLLYIMLASSLGSIGVAIYVIRVASRHGQLKPSHP